MNRVVEEWIAKAEGDFAIATREMAVPDSPIYDGICYHAQQCIEKYMKALLIARGVVPAKIHDLVELHRLLSPVCSDWQWPAEELRLLSRAAVMSRYPGEVAGREEAAAAMDICQRARLRLRGSLGVGM
jgi:HEPN domain-containing protein